MIINSILEILHLDPLLRVDWFTAIHLPMWLLP
jgi:hypothetical protein